MKTYNDDIQEIVENISNEKLPMSDIPNWNQLLVTNFDSDFTEDFQKKVIRDESIKDVDEYFETNDSYINMEVGLPRGRDGELERAKVKKRVID